MITDVTAHRQAQRQLLMLSTVMEQSPVAVMIADSETNIEYVNCTFAQLLDSTSQEMVRDDCSFAKYADAARHRYRHAWRNTVRTSGEWHGEIQGKKKNGDDSMANLCVDWWHLHGHYLPPPAGANDRAVLPRTD